MKSQRLLLTSIIGLIVAALSLSPFSALAQPCFDDNQFWYDGQQPPCNSYGFVSIGGGTYATFNVENGITYTFTTCNSPFNTMLTAYDLNGNLLFFNDDNGPECASDKASAEWIADFTGTIKVLVDSFPCTSFSCTSAVLEFRQTLNITSSNAPMCSGESRTLSANSAAGTFSGTGVTGNNFIAPVTSGTYPITYTLGVCSAMQFIQVYSTPVVNVISLDGLSFCTGDSVRLRANASSLDATITNYQWKQNGVNTGTNSQLHFVFQPDSFTVEATDSNGCRMESFPIVLTELQPPTVSFTGLNTDYCLTDAGALLIGSPGGGSFTGAGVAGSNFIPFTAGVGIHNISYSYTAPNGCDATDTKAVIVNDKPIISFTISPGSYCLDAGPVLLSAAPLGGTYSGQGVSGTTFDPTIAGVGGPFIISYTFTDTIGCRSTSSANQGITVNGLPTVTIAGVGAEYCVNASPTSLSGNPSGGTFNGNGVSGNTFYPDSAGTGMQQITYTYTDNNGCSNSNTAVTTVQPLPVVTLSGLDSVYCEDDAVVLMTASPSGGSYSGPGVIANSFNPGLAGEGGPYDVTYTLTDVNGCTGNATLNVSVNEIPVVAIIGLDETYCAYEGEQVLTLIPSGGQLSGSGVAENTFNPSLAGTGNHFIIYVYSDNAGCVNSITETVTVDECVGVDLTEIPQIRIYPNPAQGFVNVEIFGDINEETKLSVFDTHGQKVHESPMTGRFYATINLSTFPRGLYLFRLETDKGVILKKIAVN